MTSRIPDASSPKRSRSVLLDLMILCTLALVFAALSERAARTINPVILTDVDTFNVWFDADPLRVFDIMTDRWADNSRSRRHPLFSLAAYTPVKVLRLAGVESFHAVRIVFAAVGAVWIGGLFIVLRLVGCRRLDAALFTVLGGVSAAALFWFTVPDTFPFGSVSILAALLMSGLPFARGASPIAYTVLSAATLSMTVTNWMAGLTATIVAFHWRKAATISLCALAIVTLLWGAQKAVFPTSQFFIGGYDGLGEFVTSPTSGGPSARLRSFVFHTVVMPRIVEDERGGTNFGPIMTTQASAAGSGSRWGTVAVWLWGLLLGFGVWGLWLSFSKRTPLALVLTMTLLGQLVLHAVFGVETFLYSLHFAPLLIVLAGFGTLTRARPIVLALAAATIVATSVNNVQQIGTAATIIERHHVTERVAVRQAMRARPDVSWPRSHGHVVLAVPGSAEAAKSYHEPGGSFSPSVGSFGVSIQVNRTDGTVLTTGETIPSSGIDQQFVWDGGPAPAIRTTTAYYQAEWSVIGDGRTRLTLRPQLASDKTYSLVIRSVGPAGGPIRSLDWDGQRLQVNNRWRLTMLPTQPTVRLGTEGRPQAAAASAIPSRAEDAAGWAYARIDFPPAEELTLAIDDQAPNNPGSVRPVIEPDMKVRVQVPEPRFAASLDAQIWHMLVGTVGNQTRPAEPTQLPLAWAKHEAYILAALVRAGRLASAKALSPHLAGNDFFGGYGSEADAPGLAIWALEQIAVGLADPEYDRWLWPHVNRKADLLMRLLTTVEPVRVDYMGPLIPAFSLSPDATLVAQPARDGLVVGRTDGRTDTLYASAVAYRGLLDAAAIARRIGRVDCATLWQDRAAALGRSWARAFERAPQALGSRSVWPTGVWAASGAGFSDLLPAPWIETGAAEASGGPASVAGYIADAHQGLLAGRPDRAWTALNWLWTHQTSPGLFTWSSGKAGKSSFRLWERTRGWVERPNITPDYQIAAELALMQLDMLAYVDETVSPRRVVIGAGVPSSWLSGPLRVEGLSTACGEVRWSWDGRELIAHVSGQSCEIQSGLAFAGKPVRATYSAGGNLEGSRKLTSPLNRDQR